MAAKIIISIRGLEKNFPSNSGLVRAVRKIDLDVAENEFVVLLGPSGCGKTTTLRCVAGLERPDGGSIEIAGQAMDSAQGGNFVSPDRRNIGMVFQSYAVWPHLNVYQNVALPLTDGRRRLPKRQVRERVMESLRLVRMDALETRPVTDLSGGQQQRVALARAIVTQPMVLLMDEPLSNLDARLREEMRLELKKIATSVGVTTLYVTHDQAEALSLGDRICVMNEGRIQQVGSPEEVYARPPNHFVAEFVGDMNFIKGKVIGPGQIESALGVRACVLPPNCRVGSAVTQAIRPQHLDLTQNPDPDSQFPEGTVINKTYLGDAVLFEVETSGITLVVKLPGESGFAVGQRVTVVLPADHWHIYP
ncbi:MAG: ABC transporter ATP-binding protein [Alphaproteobacteria bacterium]|nr:ABC transporter ATP-binding protein [Alphaproteobacteria bacterium]